MAKVVAINGSPRMEKGSTARLLTAFVQGLEEGGWDVEQTAASQMNIHPCACGVMRCWRTKSMGECCYEDDMQALYPRLKAAEVVVLATPVYIPLPGDFQNLLNRLCPLLDPTMLVKREGRTRARFRADVNIRQFVLVSTSGWYEPGNFDTVIRVVKELAEDASVKFGGAVLRPHSSLMLANRQLTPQGQAVLEAAHQAGLELAQEGKMNPQTLAKVCQPLITEEEFYS